MNRLRRGISVGLLGLLMVGGCDDEPDGKPTDGGADAGADVAGNRDAGAGGAGPGDGALDRAAEAVDADREANAIDPEVSPPVTINPGTGTLGDAL